MGFNSQVFQKGRKVEKLSKLMPQTKSFRLGVLNTIFQRLWLFDLVRLNVCTRPQIFLFNFIKINHYEN